MIGRGSACLPNCARSRTITSRPRPSDARGIAAEEANRAAAAPTRRGRGDVHLGEQRQRGARGSRRRSARPSRGARLGREVRGLRVRSRRRPGVPAASAEELPGGGERRGWYPTSRIGARTPVRTPRRRSAFLLWRQGPGGLRLTAGEIEALERARRWWREVLRRGLHLRRRADVAARRLPGLARRSGARPRPAREERGQAPKARR